MINKFICMGNLTRDPELKKGDTYKLCTFTLAINNPMAKSEVLYIDVSTWNKIALNCANYLKKGSRIFVDGRLKQESWQSKNGEKKTKIVLVAENIRFMPSVSSQEKTLSNVEKNEEEESISQEEDSNLEISQEELDKIPF